MNSTDFQKLADEAKALAFRNTTTDWAAVCVNIVALPLTLGSFFVPTDDTSKQDEVAMPDDWLAAVAGLPAISRRGLECLSGALEAKGWVSVADARHFIEIETALTPGRMQEKPADAPAGAALLLARAERELPGTIQRFAEGAQSFVQAVGGVLSFSIEKGIWIGKGLGSVASFMRDMRKSN